jgi:hypothetical protein
MTISIVLQGRLGNQLFQYAVLRNIGLLKDYDIYYTTDFTWHEQMCLLKHFNLKSPSLNCNISNHYNQIQNSNEHVSKGGGCSTFDEGIYNIKDNTLLHGHYCNEKYFFENREIIKNELTVKGETNIECTEHINEIYKNYPDTKIVGIHLRRGDNVSQNYFAFEETNDFILKSLKKIKEKEKNIYLIFFTGGSTIKRHTNWIDNSHDDDVNWLDNYTKQFTEKYEISFGTNKNNELYDYCLLSKCDYNILPHGSSFSWMACYVNKKNDNKVYVNINSKADFYKPPDKFIVL